MFLQTSLLSMYTPWPALCRIWCFLFFSALQNAKVAMRMAQTSSRQSKSSRACLHREFPRCIFCFPCARNPFVHACMYVFVSLCFDFPVSALSSVIISYKQHEHDPSAWCRGFREGLPTITRSVCACLNMLLVANRGKFTAGYISTAENKHTKIMKRM